MTSTVAPQSSTRPAIAAILAISVAATLFLFWLIYIHPASATIAQNQGAPRGNDYGLWLFHAVSGELHSASRAPWRCPLPSSRGAARCLPAAAGQPHCSGDRGAADGFGYVLFLAERADSSAPQGRALDVSFVAVRFSDRRDHLRDATPGARIKDL